MHVLRREMQVQRVISILFEIMKCAWGISKLQ